MFWGHLDNWDKEKYAYPNAVRLVMEHIRSLDFSRVADGKYELEDGLIRVAIKETTTKPKEAQKAETHRTYTDVQFVISGEEKIGVAPWSSSQTIVKDELDTRDVAFYEPVLNEIELIQRPGMFAVFFPTDIHRPCCNVAQETNVRRMVAKIDEKLFGGSAPAGSVSLNVNHSD
ncbi:YhcH/YjgK/YiaL family protein [Paenibacillus hemerocallicola]|uniref:YhcH/YjgK/YiaL family protein n=1 Tax=Paenibacillus hemerocallicola TaxID=1172614 RepID=UPI00159EF2FB|nr:YhcH/YjgK/YiaL family protein [Paenibacillus hemerocallicola]